MEGAAIIAVAFASPATIGMTIVAVKMLEPVRKKERADAAHPPKSQGN